MTQPIALEDRGHFGPRRMSPSAGRNRGAIAEMLAQRLPEGAHVLEIASGTGEHALHMVRARPDLRWQTSDPDKESRASQDSWRLEALEAMRPSLPLDTTAPEWWGGLPDFDGIFCANMIHIAPWKAAEGLAEGAGQLLSPGGRVFLYGPFLKGADSAEGNLSFGRSLTSRDVRWGVREMADVKGLFAMHGLGLAEAIAMPANNDILVFARG